MAKSKGGKKKSKGKKKAVEDDCDTSEFDMFIFSWSKIDGYKQVLSDFPDCDYGTCPCRLSC